MCSLRGSEADFFPTYISWFVCFSLASNLKKVFNISLFLNQCRYLNFVLLYIMQYIYSQLGLYSAMLIIFYLTTLRQSCYVLFECNRFLCWCICTLVYNKLVLNPAICVHKFLFVAWFQHYRASFLINDNIIVENFSH